MSNNRRIARHHARCRGIALIWVVLTLIVFVAFVGLATDMGYVTFVSHQLQNSADAAALAAAQQVRDDQGLARQAAIDIAAANQAAGISVRLDENAGNDAAGDIVIGRWDRDSGTFEATLTAPNAVKVVARRLNGSPDGPVPLIFGPIFGIGSAQVSRPAIAMIGGSAGAGIIALNTTKPCALTLRGTAMTLNIDGGAMQVNSAHEDAVCHSGQPTVIADILNIHGGSDNNFEGQVIYDGPYNYGAPIMPDPLAFLPAPTWNTGADRGRISVTGKSDTTVNLSPGYYSGGISMTNNNGNLVLAPGIYVLNGAGLDIRGGNLTAEGVMFHIIDTTPTNPEQSHVYLGGNGNLHVTAMGSEGGIYEGVSFFQARNNTNTSTIIGTNTLDLEGTLYFPANHMNVGGTGAGFGNQLLADTIEVFGTGEVLINYDGRFPAPGSTVFLVK